MVTADEIFAQLEREFVLSPAAEPRGSAPAELFQVDGGPATVGVNRSRAWAPSLASAATVSCVKASVSGVVRSPAITSTVGMSNGGFR